MPVSTPDFDYESAIEACARGERFALRALYDQESRRLLGVALRIVRNRDVAHDVLQDCFLQVWQRASSYQRALGSARGWLYTVVRHRALDEVRRSQRSGVVEGDVEEMSDDDASAVHPPAVPFADAEALQRCLDALDERKRDCIVSAFVEGYTHDEVARRLQLPVGTVKTWIRRGLLTLRECLS